MFGKNFKNFILEESRKSDFKQSHVSTENFKETARFLMIFKMEKVIMKLMRKLPKVMKTKVKQEKEGKKYTRRIGIFLMVLRLKNLMSLKDQERGERWW